MQSFIRTIVPALVFAWSAAQTAQAAPDAEERRASREDAQEAELTQITVSARRRDESQMDVPLSLVVKTGEDLAAQRITDLSELERAVPGMIYGGLSVTPYPAILLRGVGSFSTNSGLDPSVGVAIDGAVTPQSSALAGDFSDIQRIEVLRGPQGTLFGKNSSAGLVNIVTRDPSDEWTGNFDATTGSYDEVKLRGMASGPLVEDKLLARVALYSDKRDGYIYNIGKGRKVMDDDQKGARATLLFTPTDATRLRLSAYNVHRTNDWAHSLMPARSVGPNSNPVDRTLLGDIAGPENDSVWTNGDGFIEYYTRTTGSTLQWDQKLGDEFSLTSITSYLNWYWRQYWNNLTDSPAPFTIRQLNDATSTSDQWSQELRIASPTGGRIDYVAGLYYYHLVFGATNEHRFQPNATTLQFNSSRSEVTTDNYAAFGEANFHATDELTFTAGTRWTHEDKDYFALGRQAPVGTTAFLLSGTPGVILDEAKVQNWSWRFGGRWEPSGTQMFYATAARGFKGAGFNPIPSNGSSQKVRPEVATTFEIGSKTTWLDSRLAANVALFYSRITDAQANALAITTSTGGTTIAFALANAGKVRSQGVELELNAVAAENLNLSLVGSYVDGTFLEFLGAQCYVGQTAAQGCGGTPASQDLSGTQLPLAAKWSGTFSADYGLKFASMPFDGFMRGDYSYRSDVQYSYANAPNSIEPGYGLLGATVGVRSKDERYMLAVYGKNLTNKFHVSGVGMVSPGGLGTTVMQIAPDYQRIWGATFSYSF